MLEIAGARLPRAERVLADALPLPFADHSLERVSSAQFYDHLRRPEREWFLVEARRVAAELLLVEQTRGPEHREGTEERILHNGNRCEIHTAYFSAESLTAELDGADLLAATNCYLVVRKRWDAALTR